MASDALFISRGLTRKDTVHGQQVVSSLTKVTVYKPL